MGFDSETEQRVREIRANNFGLHFYTVDPTGYWLVQLIDWTIEPPADCVVYENANLDTLDNVIQLAYRRAQARRFEWLS